MPKGRVARQHDFFFCPSDYLRDPAVLAMKGNLAALGAYSTLLFELWEQDEPGVIIDDDAVLSALAWATLDDWLQVRPLVARAFDTTSRPGFWVQKRMVYEHRRQQRFHRERSRSGKSGRIKQLMGSARAKPGDSPGAILAIEAIEAKSLEQNIVSECLNAAASPAAGPSARCLARLAERFPQLDLPVIEAKMLAKHAKNPYRNLDRAMIAWCQVADRNGWDARGNGKPRMTIDEWAQGGTSHDEG